MDYPFIEILDLKEFSLSTADAVKLFYLKLEFCRKSEIPVLKIIHGYGSSGKGGSIFIELKKEYQKLLRNKAIKNYFSGNQWNIGNEKVMELLKQLPELSYDEDLKFYNPGISVIVL